MLGVMNGHDLGADNRLQCLEEYQYLLAPHFNNLHHIHRVMEVECISLP